MAARQNSPPPPATRSSTASSPRRCRRSTRPSTSIPTAACRSPPKATRRPEPDEVEAEGPAEDGAEEPSARRSQTNLLDRLLYKGVLPRYAFPTDVVSFYVFDRDKSTPFRAEFQYEPSQGLPVALTQYAPGKVVWIDNKEWTSGALYAPVQKERFQAWRGQAPVLRVQGLPLRHARVLQRGQPRRTARLPGLRRRAEVRQGHELDPAAGLRPPGVEGPRHQPRRRPGAQLRDQGQADGPRPDRGVGVGAGHRSRWRRPTGARPCS